MTKAVDSRRSTTYELSYDAGDYLTRLEVTDCVSCGGNVDCIFTYSSGHGDPLLNGNLLVLKNADLEAKVTYTYSTLDRATKAAQGSGNSEFHFDTSAGRLTRVSPLGENNWVYMDGVGTVTKLRRAGQTVTFEFDTGSHMTKSTLSDGIEVTLEFDDNHRTTKETWTKGAQSMSRSWFYDATVSKVTKHIDWRGEDRLFEYDSDGRLTKSTDPQVTLGVPSSRQAVTSHYYNANGRRTKTVDPLGVETHYSYDADGFRTKAVSDAAGGGLQLARLWIYDGNHRITAEVDALSQTTSYA